jgi:hypothetical protein
VPYLSKGDLKYIRAKSRQPRDQMSVFSSISQWEGTWNSSGALHIPEHCTVQIPGASKGVGITLSENIPPLTGGGGYRPVIFLGWGYEKDEEKKRGNVKE